MSKNNITELREILFDTLRGLKEKSIDIDHAKAISETAQVIINSAKVEVDHARHTGVKSTTFLLEKQEAPVSNVSYQHRLGERQKHIISSVPSLGASTTGDE